MNFFLIVGGQLFKDQTKKGQKQQKLKFISSSNVDYWLVYNRAFQPVVRMWPARQFCVVWEVKYFHMFCRVNERIKPEYTMLQYCASFIALLWLIWLSLIVKILQTIFKTPLLFDPCGPPNDPADRCAARSWFKWKALVYNVCE